MSVVTDIMIWDCQVICQWPYAKLGKQEPVIAASFIVRTKKAHIPS
jgi:hypothetical protein